MRIGNAGTVAILIVLLIVLIAMLKHADEKRPDYNPGPSPSSTSSTLVR